jgi:hypothetical protein
VLAQQAARIDTFPGVVPVLGKGKKNDRIMSMSPLFKIGKVRVQRRFSDFIEQWLNFDHQKKNQDDDLLDAVEIALSTAGILLARPVHSSLLDDEDDFRDPTPFELAKAQIRAMSGGGNGSYDPDLGSEA